LSLLNGVVGLLFLEFFLLPLFVIGLRLFLLLLEQSDFLLKGPEILIVLVLSLTVPLLA